MVVFGRRTGMGGQLERRTLSFIAPPIGAHIQAAEDFAAGSIEGALRHNAVWKCVRLVADVVSCMPPMVYRGQPGVPGAVRVPPPEILVQPSADADVSDFVYMGMASLLLRGNVYGEILGRDRATGFPTQIELQHPDRVHVRVGQSGQVEYKFGNQTMNPVDVWHRMAYRMPGMHVGLSPIAYAKSTVRQSAAAQRFATDWFDAGGHPGGILKNTAKSIDQPQAKTIKERFLAAARSREPVVMGREWDYTDIKINPDESQFLNTQKYTGAQIAGLFGIQPEIVGEASEGSAITYANVESRAIDFLKFGVAGWINRWQRWMSMLTPRGQYVKLDPGGLLQGDTLTRYQAIHMLVGGRIITQDEGRAFALELPPLTPEQQKQIDALTTPLPPPIGSPKIGN